MDKRRARTEADKLARRGDILDAARRVLDRSELDGFTMDDVAAELGLAKGTLYRYVPTREAMLLALTADEYTAWFDRLERELPDSADVAATLVDTCLAQPRLLRLMSVAASVLERNVPIDTAREFKVTATARSAVAARLLAERIPTTLPGAQQLLVHIHAAAVGLYHHAHPAPVVRQLMAEPGYTGRPVDLRAELIHVVRALVAAVPVTRPQVARRRDR